MPETHATYLEAVWTMAMTKHIHNKNALAAKRSAVYTVMQNRCSGKLARAAVVTRFITCH
jgi:hypothetical protein